jgi:predicted MFS family arabinose efflux permease
MKNQNVQEDFLVPKGKAYYIFTLLMLLFIFDFIDRQVIASLFPYLKKDWGLSDTQCGLLISGLYWCFIIFVVPFSVLMDRWSRKKMIGMMAVTWSLATVACAFTRNFGQLFAARAVIGVGEAAYAPGGVSMISGLFPQRMRATLMGIFNMGATIGSAIGVIAGGYIAVHYGWRHAFGIVGVPGLFIAVLIFFVRDYKPVNLDITVHKEKDSGEKRRMSKKEIIRQFTGTPSLIFNYFAYAAAMFYGVSSLTWLPTYLNRIDNLPMDQASAKVSVLFLLAAVSGGLGGVIADRWQKKRANARALAPGIACVIWAVLNFAAFGLAETHSSRYYLLLISGLFGAVYTAGGWALTQDLVHPGLRATSGSLNVLIQHFLGSALGPLVVGILSDKYNLQTAMTVVSLVPLIAAALWFMAARYYERDLAKVEKVALAVE